MEEQKRRILKYSLKIPSMFYAGILHLAFSLLEPWSFSFSSPDKNRQPANLTYIHFFLHTLAFCSHLPEFQLIQLCSALSRNIFGAGKTKYLQYLNTNSLEIVLIEEEGRNTTIIGKTHPRKAVFAVTQVVLIRYSC